MLWLKRNLWLAIGGFVTLLLLGFGGYYFWKNQKGNTTLDAELEQSKSDLQRLYALKPHPNPKNVEAAKREQQRLQALLVEARKNFPRTPAPKVDNQGFKSLLENTIADLRREAAKVPVQLRTNYNFSFDGQIRPVSFEPGTLEPLSQQLAEIRMISTALFQAKIYRLELIRRVRVSLRDDSPGAVDFLSEGFATNDVTGMTLWPYEFVIEGFSASIAASLENLTKAPHGFFLRTIAVEPVAVAQTGLITPAATTPDRRVAGTSTNRMVSVLDEQRVRVTLRIEVIKPVK